jgi:hypothetical protein
MLENVIRRIRAGVIHFTTGMAVACIVARDVFAMPVKACRAHPAWRFISNWFILWTIATVSLWLPSTFMWTLATQITLLVFGIYTIIDAFVSLMTAQDRLNLLDEKSKE